MLRQWGHEFELEEYVRDLSGVPKPQCSEYLARRFNTPHTGKELYNQNIAITHAHLKEEAYPLMPGAQECIQACSDLGLPLGIATGAGNIEIETSLRSHNLEHFFNTVCTRDHVLHPKPAPDVYTLALRTLCINAEHAIAIEDTHNGLLSAKSAGIRTIVVPNEFSNGQDFSSADFIVENLDQAYQLIQTRV